MQRMMCAWMLLVAGVCLTGCASDRVGIDGGMATAVERYEAGDYGESYRLASLVSDSETGRTREHADLIAGMAAYHIDRPDEARTRLTPLATSTDDEVAGKASAVLGLVDMDAGLPHSAVARFRTAARRLEGNDRARALMLVGNTQIELGHDAEALAAYEAGLKIVEDPKTRAALNDGRRMVAAHPYTIQIGAFARVDNATRSASRLRVRAEGLGLAVPWIDVIRDRAGQELHAVRVGRFESRVDADRARKKLGEGSVRSVDGR